MYCRLRRLDRVRNEEIIRTMEAEIVEVNYIEEKRLLWYGTRLLGFYSCHRLFALNQNSYAAIASTYLEKTHVERIKKKIYIQVSVKAFCYQCENV